MPILKNATNSKGKNPFQYSQRSGTASAPDIKHKRGVISMARAQNPNSAGSQFFIMHEDAPHLDGEYAAFGKVTDGMEVVDKIVENAKVEDANGTVAPENQPKIISIKFAD